MLGFRPVPSQSAGLEAQRIRPVWVTRDLNGDTDMSGGVAAPVGTMSGVLPNRPRLLTPPSPALDPTGRLAWPSPRNAPRDRPSARRNQPRVPRWPRATCQGSLCAPTAKCPRSGTEQSAPPAAPPLGRCGSSGTRPLLRRRGRPRPEPRAVRPAGGRAPRQPCPALSQVTAPRRAPRSCFEGTPLSRCPGRACGDAAGEACKRSSG